MRRRLLYLILCAAVAGCGKSLLQGGEACNQLWDKIDYAKCYNDSLKAAGVSAPKRKLSPQDSFGACSPDDLANHACK